MFMITRWKSLLTLYRWQRNIDGQAYNTLRWPQQEECYLLQNKNYHPSLNFRLFVCDKTGQVIKKIFIAIKFQRPQAFLRGIDRHHYHLQLFHYYPTKLWVWHTRDSMRFCYRRRTLNFGFTLVETLFMAILNVKKHLIQVLLLV